MLACQQVDLVPNFKGGRPVADTQEDSARAAEMMRDLGVACIVPLGQAEIKKEGTDVTLISYSMMLNKTLSVAEQLAADGINAEVIDLRTLSPLDHDTLARSVQKTHKAVVIQEAVEVGGVAAQVVKSLVDSSFEYLDAPIKTVAACNTVIPFSPPLEDVMLPNEEKILAAAKEILG